MGGGVGISLLMRLGFDLGSRNRDNDPALICAVKEGHLSSVSALLDAGAYIGARGLHGLSPLHSATAKGFESIVER